MKRKLIGILCCITLLAALLIGLTACVTPQKIGASFGAGPATRWDLEKVYMEERAAELGLEIEVRVNRQETEKTQFDDCKEMIDGGIGVLILMPRNPNDVGDIVRYAKERNVKVISYARLTMQCDIDLYIGYDSRTIGQKMGSYLAELEDDGEYLVLSGDAGDSNATLLHEGARAGLASVSDRINIFADIEIPGWDPAIAKTRAKEAIIANGNRVDAIIAPNDKLAGACAEVLAELNITNPVYITGMDAELDAVKRIVAGTQSMTVYLDLKDLSYAAVDAAKAYAAGEEPTVNRDFDNSNGANPPVSAFLIVGKVIIKENIDRELIDTGYFTRDQVYGTAA